MKKILMMSVLILVSPSFAAADEYDGAEQEKHKTTAKALFSFNAGEVQSEEEMFEQLRIEEERQRKAWESSQHYQQKNQPLEAGKKSEKNE